MAKFWNFVFFQAGWFACVIGAANHHVSWAVVGVSVYIAIHIYRSHSVKLELRLLIKVLIYGVSADTLISYLGSLSFNSAWPIPYLSPIWMWTLWALVASTINGSLSWLKNRPILGAVLGVISGPLSYEAGVVMGAGAWDSSSHLGGLVLIAIAWGVAIPLFFYWNREPVKCILLTNP